MIQYEDTIKTYQKNTYTCELTVTDENNVPKDLIGQTFNFIVKNKEDCLIKDTNAKINKSIVLSDFNAQNGKIILVLDKEDTDLKATVKNELEYVAQFQLDNSGTINTLKQVNFVILDNKKKED